MTVFTPTSNDGHHPTVTPSIVTVEDDNLNTPPGLSRADLEFLVNHGISEPYAYNYAFSESNGRGIYFRHKDFEGKEVLQFKAHNPGSGPKYRFPKDQHVAISVVRWNPKRNKNTLFVEGTKGMLAAGSWAADDWNVLGTSGCQGWMAADNDQLSRLAGQRIVVVFDGDVSTNDDVWNAAAVFRSKMRRFPKTTVEFVHLTDFTDGAKDALDDVLGSVKPSERAATMSEIINTARNLGPNPDGSLPGGYIVDDFLRPSKSGGFQMQTAIDAVEDFGPIATDSAKELWRYTPDGVWVRDGERVVGERLLALMGQKYRPEHKSLVVKTLVDREPTLTDERIDTRFINTRNGLLEWKTGELHPHTPDVWVPAQIPVEWVPGADCSDIDTFLRSVLPSDSIEFFYEIAGYTIFNDYPFHHFVAFFGTGRNGKGTAMNLLVSLAGSENVSATSPQLLDSNRFRAAELYGKLANMCGDIDPKVFNATETFKKATGGDMVEAERKNGQPFRFYNRALMIGAFNEMPKTADNTVGFYDRWLVVPFTRYIRPEDRIPNFAEKIGTDAQMQGFLVKAVAGLQRLMERGHFEVPKSVQEASDEYRVTSDHIRDLVKNYLEFDPDKFVTQADLFRLYKRLVEENGGTPKQARRFNTELKTAVTEILGVELDEVAVRRGAGPGYLVKVSGIGQSGPNGYVSPM